MLTVVLDERARFCSAILPPWARKTPKVTEVLPLLYLHGLCSGDFVPALGQFLGSSAGLPAAVITKLTGTWKAAQDHWRAVNAPHLVALVRAGARFEHGVLIERPEPAAA